MAKRKYARMGEEVVAFQCTKPKCKWQGKDKERERKIIDKYQTELVCPECGNPEFYGLLNY